MGKIHLVAVVACFAACGPPPLPLEEQDQCKTHDECVVRPDDGSLAFCDDDCVAQAVFGDCCDCLVDFQCIEVDADRCVSNIDGGGQVNVAAGCSTDSARCGTACDGVIGPAGE